MQASASFRLTIGILLLALGYFGHAMLATEYEAELRHALEIVETQEKSKEKEIEQLKAEAISLKYKTASAELELSRLKAATDFRLNTTNNSPTNPTEVATKNEKDEELEESVATIYASLNRSLALSSTEQEKIKSALQAGLSTHRSENEILREVLSDSQMESYQNQQLEFRRSIRSEVSEQEAYKFGRKLALSAEQEQQIAYLIKQTRDEIFPITNEELDPSLQNKETRVEHSRRLLTLEQQRQALLTERVKAVLTEKQYNDFLELQATSTANQAHDSYLDSSAK